MNVSDATYVQPLHSSSLQNTTAHNTVPSENAVAASQDTESPWEVWRQVSIYWALVTHQVLLGTILFNHNDSMRKILLVWPFLHLRKPKLRESKVTWPRPRSTCRSQDRVRNPTPQSQACTHQAALPPEWPPQLSLLRTLYGPWLSHGRFQDPLLNSGFLKF